MAYNGLVYEKVFYLEMSKFIPTFVKKTFLYTLLYIVKTKLYQIKMIINNTTLAYICNDLQNAQDYKIDGNDCYYKDELIGEIKEELKDGVLDIYFKPIKPVEYINVNITIDKP